MKKAFKQNGWSFATAKLRTISLRLIDTIAFAVIIGFSMAACSDDGGGGGGTDLTGTWVFADDNSLTLTFTSNSWTMDYSGKGRQASGTYTVSGNTAKCTFTYAAPNQCTVVVGDFFTLTIVNNNTLNDNGDIWNKSGGGGSGQTPSGGGSGGGQTPGGSGKPSAPTGLKVTAVTTDSITLSWNPVSNALWYEIRISKSDPNGNYIGIASSTTTSFAFESTYSDFRPNTTYYFKVAGYNHEFGWGPVSDYVSAKTP
jgi:hypothetical protein